MQGFVDSFNLTVFVLFIVLYAYQIFYVFVSLKVKPQPEPENLEMHRFAVIIAARNEENMISNLIESIKGQTYPSELVDTYVIADNCTDDTAGAARAAGAHVIERFNKEFVGKGFALDYAFKRIESSIGLESYDGYFIFDADNLLEPNYIEEMNKTFCRGYRVITSYRNSKNYDSNWISAGYALWFLREARFINQSRMKLGTSCAVSGTGFLVHSDIIKKNGGWKHHLLTEDIEFSVDNVINGERIGYCGTARLYDEQPTKFKQSWNQRLRWSKGFYQVFGNYAGGLIKNLFKRRSFACYDLLLTIFPMMFLAVFSLILNICFFAYSMSSEFYYAHLAFTSGLAICAYFVNFYLAVFAFGLVTTIAEWKSIKAPTSKKIRYLFTFPVFLFTYMPIAFVALFKKVNWTPISHSVVMKIEDVKG